MEQEGVRGEMDGVTNGKVLAFGGAEVQVPIFGPASTDVQVVLENIMAVTGAMTLTSSAKRKLSADKGSGRLSRSELICTQFY